MTIQEPENEPFAHTASIIKLSPEKQNLLTLLHKKSL